MHQSKGIVAGPGAEMESRNGFGDRIDGKPEPNGLGNATDTPIHFIELDQGEGEICEAGVVKASAVGSHAFEPACEGGIGAACVADQDGDIEAFSQEPQNHFDLLRWGFEVVKGGAFAAREGVVTPLALEVLDVVRAAFAIADQSMDVLIGDAEVFTGGVQAGQSLGGKGLLAATRTFAQAVGDDVALDWNSLEPQPSAAVWAIVGRFGFPASGQPSFGGFPMVLPLFAIGGPVGTPERIDETDKDEVFTDSGQS